MADRPVEIAASIRQRIVSGLHLGTLGPGARLPSTRELAVEFGVAPRTVMSAYRLLESEGLVALHERSGIYVAPGHGGGPMPSQLSGWVVEVLIEARAREVPPIGFPERVRRCLETLRLRAACIAGNEDQLEQICRELHDDYGIVSESVIAERLVEPDAETQRILAQAHLLVSTAAHATETQRVAQRLGKESITVALRAALMSEITRQLARGPVYMIGTDPRFRETLQTVFAPTGHGQNMHAVILGEDDPDRIPTGEPTYIMGRAHARLGDTPLTRRVVPVRRVFSDEMARELLSFIVRANMSAMGGRVQ